jgi:hypothetical protein
MPYVDTMAQLVASATPAADTLAAAGRLFAEIDMFVECVIYWRGNQLHFLLREEIPFPGFDGGAAAEKECRQDGDDCKRAHGG